MPGLEEPGRQWRHSTVTRDEVSQRRLSVTHHSNNRVTEEALLTSNMYFMPKTEGQQCLCCKSTNAANLFVAFYDLMVIFGRKDVRHLSNHYNFHSTFRALCALPGVFLGDKPAFFPTTKIHEIRYSHKDLQSLMKSNWF